MESGAVANVPPMSLNYFAPDAPDLVYQGVARVLHFKLTTQPTNENQAEFDLRRRKLLGGGLPEAPVPVSRLQNASLPRADKSLVLASAQGSSGVTYVTGQMGRFFRSRGHLWVTGRLVGDKACGKV